MKSKIVWVFGGSASGKETFIKKMEKNPLEDVLDLLSSKNHKVVVSTKSVDFVSKKEGDDLGVKRKEILDEVLQLSKEDNIVILIKGQDLDLNERRLEKLRKHLSSHDHLIVYLYADSESMYGRVKRKWWWKEEWDKKGYMKWVKHQVSLLSKLDGFKIIALDSGDKGNYKQREFPPKF